MGMGLVACSAGTVIVATTAAAVAVAAAATVINDDSKYIIDRPALEKLNTNTKFRRQLLFDVFQHLCMSGLHTQLRDRRDRTVCDRAIAHTLPGLCEAT